MPERVASGSALPLKPDTTRPRGLVAKRILLAGLFALGASILAAAIRYRMGPELIDDGSFFLRYAVNAAKGHFWVWNIGDAPVWGASAPIWPILVAAPIKLGIDPKHAIEGVGIALSIAAVMLVATALYRRFGLVAAAALVVFASMDTVLTYYASAGLESPLSAALMAIGIWLLLESNSQCLIGIAAGALMVNKLDMIPAGLFLLAAFTLKQKIIPKKSVFVAGTMAATWYLFAWRYFGSAVPNSFLTKTLFQGNQPRAITWTWFSHLVLLQGVHVWIIGFALIALGVGVWRRAPLTLFLAGTAATYLVAYSVKYPFEPYDWYAVPAIFCLLTGAAIGLHSIAQSVRHVLRSSSMLGSVAASLLATIALALVVVAATPTESQLTTSEKAFASLQERDRANAGRWVAQNTPPSFVVLTEWGNPAYYSQRKVIDTSFLNRRYQPGDLVASERPDVIIFQGNPGSTPMAPVFAIDTVGYRVVKTFDASFQTGLDYYFSVLVRTDVLDQVSNVDVPRNLMTFVHDTILGQNFGLIHPQGVSTVFVAPGLTPTSLTFDGAGYLTTYHENVLTIRAMMAANVPPAAVAAGGGKVGFHVYIGSAVVREQLVDTTHPFTLELGKVSLSAPIRFVVDDDGNPNSDWLLLSLQ